jgi:hypothetical protein
MSAPGLDLNEVGALDARTESGITPSEKIQGQNPA